MPPRPAAKQQPPAPQPPQAKQESSVPNQRGTAGGMGTQPPARPAAGGSTGTPLEHWARMPGMAGPAAVPGGPGGAVRSGTSMAGPLTTPSTPLGASAAAGSSFLASTPATSAAPARRTSQGSQEGSVGQHWRVLQSKDFCDVIVRETQEVTSRELRRIQPSEVCVQRGTTVELANRLVRMPIHPDGWVTVHARHIGGPTFMEEVNVPRGAGVPPSGAVGARSPTRLGMGPAGRSVGAQSPARPGRTQPTAVGAALADSVQRRATGAKSPPRTAAAGMGQENWSRPDDGWVKPSAPSGQSPPQPMLQPTEAPAPAWTTGPTTGPSYGRDALLGLHERMRTLDLLDEKASRAAIGLRMLHLPVADLGGGGGRASRRDRDRDRDRDKRERQQQAEEDDDRPHRQAMGMCARRAQAPTPAIAPGEPAGSSPGKHQPGAESPPNPAAAAAAAAEAAKKQNNCPTQ